MVKRVNKTLKVLCINLLLMTSAVGSVVLAPMGIELTYNIISLLTPGAEEQRAALPNYAQLDWAEQHFQDLEGTSSAYHDFVIWKSEPYESPTLNIGLDGLRDVVQAPNVGPHEVWLFGGSTMWGYGSNDANTIPSHLSQIAEKQVKNYAQPGYHARQSLNELVDIYADPKQATTPARTIIFYDGVNDVLDKCRATNSTSGTVREQQIRTAVSRNMLSPAMILMPALALIDQIRQAFDKRLMNSGYVCHDDPVRAEKIARSLVNDWRSADAVARRNGDRFIAILQPVSYLSETKLDHIDLFRDGWKEAGLQYQSIYPAIRRYAEASEFEFYDFSRVLDTDDYVYIDFCHLSPNGNQLVAQRLAPLVGETP